MGKLRRWMSVCALLLPIAFSTSAWAGSPHNSPLTDGTVDRLANGDVVISFVAGGDLQGHVTFTVHQASNGALTGGEWGFTVAHADNTDPATGLDPELEPHNDDGTGGPDRGFLRLIQQGSLNGTIGNVSLTFDADGALTAMSAELTVDQGAGQFDGATGSGQATLSGLTLVF